MSTPTNPLTKAIKKAYRSTDKYPVDELLKKRSYWQRKVTIATNKLAAVQKQLDAKLIELATPKGGDQ